MTKEGRVRSDSVSSKIIVKSNLRATTSLKIIKVHLFYGLMQVRAFMLGYIAYSIMQLKATERERLCGFIICKHDMGRVDVLCDV